MHRRVLTPPGRKATQCSPLRKILTDRFTFFLSMYAWMSVCSTALYAHSYLEFCILMLTYVQQ